MSHDFRQYINKNYQLITNNELSIDNYLNDAIL